MCKYKNLKIKFNFIRRRLFYFIFINLFIIIVISYNYRNSIQDEINPLDIKIVVDRFDQVFDSLSESNIVEIKNDYPFLFPGKYSDDFWINKSNDTLYSLLKDSVDKNFMDLLDVENDLLNLYKHLKDELPQIRIPKVISIINNVDYENKVILADTLLIISIDSYLGSDNILYDGIPSFIKKEMDIKYLSSHITEKYFDKIIKLNSGRNFLSKMIFYGKKLYFKDIIMKTSNDAIKIGYTRDENIWVNENQIFIWQYFIEKQLLFKTDERLDDRFLFPAPFSKFYLEIDNNSPGKIGQWIGWQIVKSYSNEFPDKSLKEILSLEAEELFNKSNYKPRRIWQ